MTDHLEKITTPTPTPPAVPPFTPGVGTGSVEIPGRTGRSGAKCDAAGRPAITGWRITVAPVRGTPAGLAMARYKRWAKLGLRAFGLRILVAEQLPIDGAGKGAEGEQC